MLPDAIIIGDSHSNALQAGCAAHGCGCVTHRHLPGGSYVGEGG